MCASFCTAYFLYMVYKDRCKCCGIIFLIDVYKMVVVCYAYEMFEATTKMATQYTITYCMLSIAPSN